MISTKRCVAGLILGLVVAGGSVACHSGGKQSKDSGSISIGVAPTAGALQVYVADQQGYFKDSGLSVKLTKMAGLSQGPAVAGRQLDIVQSVQTVLITAQQQRIKLTAIAGGQVDTPSNQLAGVYVAKDSSIASYKQLAGKRIGTPAVSGSIHVLSLASIDKDGGEPSGVNAVQIASGDLQTQLSSGRVDAVEGSVPYDQQLEAAGYRNLGDPSRILGNNVLATLWASTSSWAKGNPDEVADFIKALTRADSWIKANPKPAIALYAQISNLDVSLLSKAPVPVYRAAIKESDMAQFVTVMKDARLLNGTVDTKGLVYSSAS